MTHYATAAGPKVPDRVDRIVAVIGQTPDDSFCRRAASAQDVHRIAGECGVSAEAIQWAVAACPTFLRARRRSRAAAEGPGA